MQSFARLGVLLAACSLPRIALAAPTAPAPAAAPGTVTAPPTAAASPSATPSAPAPAPAPPANPAVAPPTADAPAAAAPPAAAPPSGGVVDGRAPSGAALDATARLYAEPVPVWFSGEDNEQTLVLVYPDWATPGSVPPLAQCRMPCGFQMQRGRYRIEVQETEDTLGGSRPVSIEGPSRLLVTPRDRSKRTAGLVLGIGGIVAVIAGAGIIVHGLDHSNQQCFSDGCLTRWNSEATAGLLVLLAGAAMTPIGWVMFGKSFRPAIDVQPARAARVPTGRIGLVPLRGGAGLGASFVF